MNNGCYEKKLLTKPQADAVFSFTKSQWEARAAGSSLVPIDWHIRFSRHDTGLQILGYEPLTGFGFSVPALYANDTDPPIMVIIRNYFLPRKLPPMGAMFPWRTMVGAGAGLIRYHLRRDHDGGLRVEK